MAISAIGNVRPRLVIQYVTKGAVSRSSSAIKSYVIVAGVHILEKWFPLQGERVHSLYFWSFQEQNREGVENKTTDQSIYPRL